MIWSFLINICSAIFHSLSPVKFKKILSKNYLLPFLYLCTGCALINPPEDTPPRASLSNLIITEIHYNPFSLDTSLADALEFIELYNRGKETISLDNVSISDGISYRFNKGAVIKPGEFLVLASNKSEFKKRYNFEPFDQYSGNLKNSGERLALMDLTVEKEFLVIEYDDQSPWPPAADGSDYSLVLVSMEENVDLSLASQWRISFKKGGSPGSADPGPVFINEIMPHTDPPLEDAIELYNPNGFPVDISGWYLTDARDTPNKFRIPQETVIQPDGYLVFYSKDFNNPALPNPFNLSENGEEVYLFSTGSLLTSGYVHGFSYNAIENAATFGRYVNSAGEERFTSLQQATLGAPNSPPLLGEVIITEIMYNAQNGRDEYIEIKNISNATVPLFDPKHPVNTWKIKGFDFTFPVNVALKSGEIVIVSSDTISVEDFRAYYNVPAEVRIFNTALGGLRNSGDTITLLKPLEPNTEITEVRVPYMAVENVAYQDGKLWPKEADGKGMALIRKNYNQFSDDPNNWIAGLPSPGRD